MVWLKSPKSQLSKTFFRLKIHWLLRNLWAKMSLTTTMQQCYSCLMSEMLEMWNISIKDQRQHYTQQCYSCQRHQRCEISQCYVIAVCNSNHLWHLRHLLLSNVMHVRDVRDMQIDNTIQSKVSNVTHVGDVKYLNTVIT